MRGECAYAWESDVWTAEVACMSEMDRAQATEDQHAWLGVIGDRNDDQ